MKQEFVTLPRSVVEQVFYHLIRGDADAVCWADGVIKPALEQPQRKLTPQDIADSALLGNIESPFNACMHQEHCKRWKAQADQQHQGELSSDNDLQCENSHLITTSSSVQFGYKLVPMEPTGEMLRAMSSSKAVDNDGEFPSLSDLIGYSGDDKTLAVMKAAYAAMLAAAPEAPAQQPTIPQGYKLVPVDQTQGEMGALPEIVERVLRSAGKTRRETSNPRITANECIKLANWIVANTNPQPAQQPLTDEQIEKICPSFDDPMRREMWKIGFKSAHNIK